MNSLNNFDKTDIESSIVPTDDLVRFLRSKVKVTVADQMVKASMSTLGR